LAIGICGGIVGAYCAYTAFRNGQMLASGLDGVAFGAAFAAVVVGSWFLLPLAALSPRSRAIIMRAGWALCLAFVLINAIGFTATHRTHTVGDKANAITAYDVSLKSLSEAQERLSALKANPRWAKTSGCSDATAERSIEFCGQVRDAQASVSSNQAVIATGKPATADAQADTIAWATRIDASVVSRALPIFMAVVLDIAASMFIWAAMTTYGPSHSEPKIVEKPKARKAKVPSRKTAKQVAALKKAVGIVDQPRLTKSGKIDGRTRQARAVKRVTNRQLLPA
jgi:hypothetical protein